MAITGNMFLVRDGVRARRRPRPAPAHRGRHRPRHRAAAAAGRRRPQSSSAAGYTMVELAKLFERLGADEALNLDGGGSSTMLARQADGQVEVAQPPSDGAPRPVRQRRSRSPTTPRRRPAEPERPRLSRRQAGDQHQRHGRHRREALLHRARRPSSAMITSRRPVSVPYTSVGASQPIDDDRGVQRLAVRTSCSPTAARPRSASRRRRTARTNACTAASSPSRYARSVTRAARPRLGDQLDELVSRPVRRAGVVARTGRWRWWLVGRPRRRRRSRRSGEGAEQRGQARADPRSASHGHGTVAAPDRFRAWQAARRAPLHPRRARVLPRRRGARPARPRRCGCCSSASTPGCGPPPRRPTSRTR